MPFDLGGLEKLFFYAACVAIGVLGRDALARHGLAPLLKAAIVKIGLPSLIFVAVAQAELGAGAATLPILAFIAGVIGLGAALLADRLSGAPRNPSALLMAPSLAPGMSCFPFVGAMLGGAALSEIAIADLGVKLFVLIGLYVFALRLSSGGARPGGGSLAAGRALAKRFVGEPTTLALMTALLLQAIGAPYEATPWLMRVGAETAATMLTPLVMVFIGASVRVRRSELRRLSAMLTLRAGAGLLISAFCLAAAAAAGAPLSATSAVGFTALMQSAVSFHALAHIAAVKRDDPKSAVFDETAAVNLLAVSLPLSSLMVTGVLAAGESLASPATQAVLGALLLAAPLAPRLASALRRAQSAIAA